MILLRTILLSILIFSISLSESVEITVYSNSFTIDTVYPEIDLLEPGHGDVYEHNEIIEVSWIGSDDSPSSSPVTVGGISNAVDLTAQGEQASQTGVNCALFSDRSAKCWGKNSFGLTGNNSTTPSIITTPILINTGF